MARITGDELFNRARDDPKVARLFNQGRDQEPEPAEEKGINIAKLLSKPNINEEIKIDWVMPHMFPAGYVTLLVGDPKAGKTWLSLRMAAELSKGGTILDGFTDTPPCRVLYLMGDTGPQLVNYRLRKTGWGFNDTMLRFVYAEEVRREGADLDLSTDEGCNLLNALLTVWDPKIMFVDTLTSFHGVDESDNSAIKPLISWLRDCAMKRNIAIVLMHHTRKKKRSEMSMTMTQHDSVGAGVLSRLVGNIVGVEKKVAEDGTSYTVRSLASWFKEFPPFSFTLVDEVDADGREWLRMPVELSVTLTKTTRQIIFDAINNNYWDGTGFTRQDIMKLTKLSHSVVSKILNNAVEAGVLVTHGSTRNKLFGLPVKEVDELKLFD
ncbi:AAA family ATPase [Desulfallas thermosapovorans]|uniref:AAA domain-containing protein n=1 Tax=Desulfallas thermosapovorans DSM 6562 TaxID=1121431 RepID=A0A5S4ZVQ5_9FIRM|nr:AAA family ATPase [Desulfallas thermosapovorans]TYO97043.1 AAA domain-containing protein [Desulfallas thermosapovorans DSM 6562]